MKLRLTDSLNFSMFGHQVKGAFLRAYQGCVKSAVCHSHSPLQVRVPLKTSWPCHSDDLLMKPSPGQQDCLFCGERESWGWGSRLIWGASAVPPYPPAQSQTFKQPGQRALGFVLANQGMIDKTLLIDVGEYEVSLVSFCFPAKAHQDLGLMTLKKSTKGRENSTIVPEASCLRQGSFLYFFGALRAGGYNSFHAIWSNYSVTLLLGYLPGSAYSNNDI
eukprot:1148084-Pelagomonas_calceolata.AAC.3